MISSKKDIVIDELKKLPKTMSRAAQARVIYKKYKHIFSNVENVRSTIRNVVGQKGKRDRHLAVQNDIFEEKRSSSVYQFLPESHADTFEPFYINQTKTLILSDLHLPYQDNKAIQLALKYGMDKEVNCILINGDLIDFAGISRHERDWRQRSIEVELNSVKSFLNGLRGLFPKTRIVFKYGNHDERWEKYLFQKAPELFGCPDFELEILLKLGELKIEVVKDKRPIRIGKLTVLHGHEMTGGSGGVNPARATFLKTIESVIVGHYHKTSQHTEASMFSEVYSVNSTGCLCGMNPHYMPINKWNHGFAYVELDVKSGEYELHNLKIIKGKVY